MQRKRVGILMFEDVEVLDFAGPFEVFSITRLNEALRQTSQSPFEVLLVAEHAGPLSAVGGLRVIPDYTLPDCPPLDVLVVPGGIGVRKQVENRPLLEWLGARASEAQIAASVCTGALLLAMTGHLGGREATTHWAYLDQMQQWFADVKVQAERRFVVDGKYWTSAGVSAGIDLSLAIVEQYVGPAVAAATARRMEYESPGARP